MSAFLYSPSGNLRVIPASDHWQTQDLLTVLSQDNEAVYPDSVYILHNGRLWPPCTQDTLNISTNDVVRVSYRLPGGKGGFGSMLRAIGAQIEKTTSREACRDLSGRRMRDVNDEKKITEWVANQADRERELAKQKQERLEKRRAGPKHKFDDTTYTKQIQDNLEKIDDALKQGLKASTSASGSEIGVKRTSTTSGDVSKKRKMWMGVDEEEFDDSDDDETQMITDQPSSSTCTSTISTPATSTTTRVDVSVESNSRGKRSAHQPSTSAATISDTSTNIDATCNTASCNTAVSTDSSSEGNSIDETEMNMTKDCGVVSKTEEKKPNEIDERNIDEEKLTKEKDMKPFNIDDYNTAEELESLGLEPLKEHLKTLGLKCGGTLQERAQRLFLTKGKALEDLDSSLFAKPSKGKGKQKKK